MARIAGIDIPRNKHICISLTYIFGIGRPTAKKILADLGIDETRKAGELTEEEVIKIREYIDTNLKIEGDLRREVMSNIKRLKEIKSFRGTRHSKQLPARGQRTKTNSRTVRGNVRRTMGSGRKDTGQKT